MTGKRDAHERLPELIAAAVRVFTREGYRLARMSGGAAEMGLSGAALYWDVGKKGGLVGAAHPPRAAAGGPANGCPAAVARVAGRHRGGGARLHRRGGPVR